jgi:hypothetical protein
LHIVRLQQQTIMPFIMQQQLHAPPISDMHRFCMVLQATLSSHTHMIFMPPVHFSIVTLQRGTMIVDMGDIMPGMVVPIPGIEPGMPIVVLIGFIIVAIMSASPRKSCGTVSPCVRRFATGGEVLGPGTR